MGMVLCLVARNHARQFFHGKVGGSPPRICAVELLKEGMFMNIAVLVGSLRQESLNLRLARAFERVAPEEMNFDFILLHDIPLYNPDNEKNPPAEVVALKERIKAADAVLIVTPEYNRSVPAVLKNSIEWSTRPPGTNVFTEKPALVAGASAGPLRTAPAQQHLKAVLLHLGMHVQPSPEIYIQAPKGLFAEDGEISADDTKEFLTNAMEKFQTHVNRFLKD